jgi:hypothetical protein
MPALRLATPPFASRLPTRGLVPECMGPNSKSSAQRARDARFFASIGCPL